jgi:hypothetical protein
MISLFGETKKIMNEPPGGKINLPSSSLVKVLCGDTIRLNAITPLLGNPSTNSAYAIFTSGFGSGERAVFAGVTFFEILGFPGGIGLNQIYYSVNSFSQCNEW